MAFLHNNVNILNVNILNTLTINVLKKENENFSVYNCLKPNPSKSLYSLPTFRKYLSYALTIPVTNCCHLGVCYLISSRCENLCNALEVSTIWGCTYLPADSPSSLKISLLYLCFVFAIVLHSRVRAAI